MDKLTPEQRRRSMQANKPSGTKIEKLLGSALFAKGLRYRKNNKKFFGTPDFTFKKYKIAIFADGEFWHGKDWETRKRKLGNNAAYWFDKIERNLERDYKVNKKLTEEGWTVLRFWESDIKSNLNTCVEEVEFSIKRAQKDIANKKLEREAKRNSSTQDSLKIVKNYLKTKQKEGNSKLKKNAVKHTQKILHYKYPEDKITQKVAEDLLKYGATE